MSEQNGNGGALVRPQQESPANKLASFLKAREKNLAQYARNHVKPATMIRLAVFEFANSEWLQKCQPETVYSSLVLAAQLGLEPSGIRGEAYLVPFKGKCTLIPGWRGLIKLALRSKAVRSVYAHLVYEGDEFVVNLGTEVSITHRPLLDNGAGEVREIVAAYAVAVLENGERDVEVMDRGELDRLREFASKTRGGKDSPAYAEWADQMYRKAPIRRLCKRLPLGDDYFTAAKMDELSDAGEPEKIAKFIDVEATETKEDGAVEVVSGGSKLADAAKRAGGAQ